MPVNSLAFIYILSYCMYMCVSDLLILSRAGIVEINNMMQPHGGGRMEEKHSHAQHGDELLRIRLSLIEQGLPRGKHMFVKM